MQKHFQSMHIYLNILNMLKDSQYICVHTCIRFSGLMLYLDNPNIGCASKMTIHFGAQYISRTRMILVVCKSLIIRRKWKWVGGCIYYLFSSAIQMACVIDLLFGLKTCKGWENGPGSQSPRWKKTTLAIFFGDCKEPPLQLHTDRIDTKTALMQALADCKKDDRLDDSAVEINSDDEFTSWS